ncbi:pyridoxal-dependent decarboxylase [Bacillus licheniformis]
MKQSSKQKNFDSLFMHNGEQGIKAYRDAVETAVETLWADWKNKSKPYSGKMPKELDLEIKSLFSFQEAGESLADVLEHLKEAYLPHRIHVEDPKCAAHLHCPPLIPALAAEMLISVLNQSMDSFDQSGAASLIEEEMVQWLCRKFEYGKDADGTFTSGGTQSNYMGLLFGPRCLLRKAVELECTEGRTAAGSEQAADPLFKGCSFYREKVGFPARPRRARRRACRYRC